MGGQAQEKEKSKKGTHIIHIIRSKWGDFEDVKRFWRSIFDVKEKKETTKKGCADAQTMSQLEKQTGPSQSGLV